MQIIGVIFFEASFRTKEAIHLGQTAISQTIWNDENKLSRYLKHSLVVYEQLPKPLHICSTSYEFWFEGTGS